MTKDTSLLLFDSVPDTQLYEYKLSTDKMLVELSKYGLTTNQSKVFIYLGKYGAKTAPEVCKALKLPRTETYHLLSVLQSKGIVSATFQHPTQFNAMPLDKAIWTLINSEKERIKHLEKNEKEVSELWHNIPNFESSTLSEESKFQMLQGANQINSKITEMTDSFSDEFLILGSEKDFIKFYHADFLESFIKSKQKFRLLNSCSDKTLYIFDDLNRKNIKKLGDGIQDNLCFMVKDDKEVLFFIKNSSISAEPYAMWTDSKAMVYSMQLLFNAQWEQSKNIHL